MVTYDTFRAFLRSEGCEEAFDRAFYAHNHATAFDDRMWEAVGDKGSLFGRVFRWDSTPEGRPFWRSIDKAWHDQLAATGCLYIFTTPHNLKNAESGGIFVPNEGASPQPPQAVL